MKTKEEIDKLVEKLGGWKVIREKGKEWVYAGVSREKYVEFLLSEFDIQPYPYKSTELTNLTAEDWRVFKQFIYLYYGANVSLREIS